MERNLKKLVFIISVVIFGILLRIATESIYSLIFNTYDLSTFTGVLLRSIFVLSFIIVWLLITLRKEVERSKLAWLLFLVIDPVMGMTFFLSFGRSFRMSIRSRKRSLGPAGHYLGLNPDKTIPITQPFYKYMRILNMASTQNALPLSYQSSQTTLINNGETFYPDLVNSIKAATHYILIEVYILRYDLRGQEIIELLKQKADEGLKVVLMIDGLGSARFARFKSHVFKHSHIEYYVFDRIKFPLFNTRITYRNHRKLFITDSTAYVGGMNIGDEYDNSVPYYTFFKDTMVKLEGDAVKSVLALFKKDYFYVTGTPLNVTPVGGIVASKGYVQIVESGPDSKSTDIHDLYLGLIMRADQHIQIMTPYIALDDELIAALKMAIKQGVKVDIIIPGKPDKIMVYMVTRYYAGLLSELGVNIYIYQKGFIHSKTMVVDEELGVIGSYNLDNRSARIDFEVATVIINETVDALIQDFHETLKDSSLETLESYRKRSFIRRFVEHTLSLFSSLV